MFIVPVIDLQGGQVVHAVRGQRQTYRPIESTLCTGSAPAVVARALVDASGADRLYIADLDALQGGRVQRAAVEAVADAVPGVALWLDAGVDDDAAVQALHRDLPGLRHRLRPVLASETLRSRAALQRCLGADAQALLSLDRRNGAWLDAGACRDAVELWPAQVIMMTLERVGADEGPDLDTFAELRRRAPPGTQLFGAGGLRDRADAAACEAAGAAGWLVASALHRGRL